MTRRKLSLVTVALTIATLMVAAIAAPVSARHATRWVDDDAGGNGGPAACQTAGYTSIQAAINASSKWDRVNVCPGTYTEQLTLDVRGIAVQAVPRHHAHLVAPPAAAAVGGVTSVARLTAWAARLIGFRIDIPAGPPPFTTTGTPISCTPIDVAVLVLGQRARVRLNVVDSTGNATLSGACGYGYGIVFGQHVLSQALRPPPFRQPSVGRAVLNEVRDFKAGGILVEGADFKVRVDQNTLSYLHADDPGCSPTFLPCIPFVSTAQVNNAFVQTFGIGAEDDAAALIENNTVTSNNVLGPSLTAPLGWGIALNGASNASVVRNNDVTAVGTGIFATGNTNVPAEVGVGGAAIYGNVVFGSTNGIKVEDNGHNVHDNLASGGAVGMSASGVQNHIHDNDFIGVHPNTLLDCLDDSPPGSLSEGTSNLWAEGFNAGATSSPMDLCHGP
jgi:hypothetical protein